jgi:hypothetical protein
MGFFVPRRVISCIVPGFSAAYRLPTAVTIYHLPFTLYHPHSMKFSRRIVIAVLMIFALITIAFVTARRNCPSQGLALTRERRDFHRLKNRTTTPQAWDFDNGVTLTTLLQPGDDRTRWSNFRAARIEGYVVSVAPGPLELTNCYLPGRRDTHIHIGLRPDAPPSEQFVVETTPRMEDLAKRQGGDWSEDALKGKLLGRMVRFEGWLFFDTSHAGESENIAPRTAGNWRATAWEIHPVTKFEILE